MTKNIFLEALKQRNIEIPEIPQFSSNSDYLRYQCDSHNKVRGKLNEKDGINCEKCLNRGFFDVFDEKNKTTFQRECSCMEKRRSVQAMKSSHLEKLLNRSFDSFEIHEEWQQTAKNAAVLYSQQKTERWLYMSGVHGCGKTHLCTAVCKALMDKGRNVEYLLWTNISRKLDALKFKYEEYEEYLDMLKNADILYIDDFLKNSDNGHDYQEIKKAYIVINARYFADKKTVISSEISLRDYYAIDGAAAGRIKQKAMVVPIKADDSRDFRMKGY